MGPLHGGQGRIALAKVHVEQRHHTREVDDRHRPPTRLGVEQFDIRTFRGLKYSQRQQHIVVVSEESGFSAIAIRGNVEVVHIAAEYLTCIETEHRQELVQFAMNGVGCAARA